MYISTYCYLKWFKHRRLTKDDPLHWSFPFPHLRTLQLKIWIPNYFLSFYYRANRPGSTRNNRPPSGSKTPTPANNQPLPPPLSRGSSSITTEKVVPPKTMKSTRLAARRMQSRRDISSGDSDEDTDDTEDSDNWGTILCLNFFFKGWRVSFFRRGGIWGLVLVMRTQMKRKIAIIEELLFWSLGWLVGFKAY